MSPTGLAQNLSFILLGEDKTASKTMTKAQQTAEVVTGRIGGAFSKLGGIIGGEFGQVLDQAGSSIEDIGAKGVKLSTVLGASGAIVTGAGIALAGIGSGEQAATAQLDQAIKNAGESVDKYSGQIDKAVAHAENLGKSSQDTKNALQLLIPAAGGTQQALDRMGVVEDLAAAKHISLASAASQVARILGGSGAKTLTQYGITMEKASDPAKALAAAQAVVASSSATLEAAQKRLADLQDIDHAKKTLTISDHIALQNAQDAVTAASGKLSAAQDKLAGTSTVTITKTQAGSTALDQLSAKLKGQASASVDSFGGQINVLRTKVEDWTKEMAGPASGALTALGPALSVTGVLLDLHKSKLDADTKSEIEKTAASVAATTATEDETGAQIALDGAMDANPIGLVATGLGILAGVVGGSLLLGGLTQAAKETADYTGTLGKNTGAITANTRAQVVSELLKDGALKNAEKLRISTSLVVDKVLGVAGATATYNAALKGAQSTFTTADGTYNKMGEHVAVFSQAQLDAKKAYDALTGSVSDQTQSLKDSIEQAKLAKSALDDTGNSADTAAGKVGGLASQLHNLGLNSPAATKITVQSLGMVSPAAKHAAGGQFVATSPTMLTPFDQVGEAGPELVSITPLNAGRLNTGGGSTVVNINISGPVYGDGRTLAKTIHGELVNFYRSGGAKTEFKHALGIN